MSATKAAKPSAVEEANTMWAAYLTGDHSRIGNKIKGVRSVFRLLPADPRCIVCKAPFRGVGSMIVSALGFSEGHSSLNSTLCDRCERMAKRFQTGVEVQLTMLFADIRGSTRLAESMGASEFHQLINRFYRATTDVLVKRGALIDKLIGDEVAAMFVPGIAGSDYMQSAIEAARDLLICTGHTDPEGPWAPVGVGVHTGVAYVGAVGSNDSMTDITVLGDSANIAARLASQAGAGEALISSETFTLGGIFPDGYQTRSLTLKGKDAPVLVRVMMVTA
jgi:adenylate cyclase